MRLGLTLLLSVFALFVLASALLADDGSEQIDKNALPDTSTSAPVALAGVVTSFSLEKQHDFKHSPRRSVLYSMAIPGLGQANNGKWAKASAFVVIGSLLVTKTLVESQRADRFLHLSRNAATPEERKAFYDDYTRHFDTRDRLIWWAVGFWAFNMLDAYIDGHLFAFSRQ